MTINRDIYLSKLIDNKHNEMIKVITGLRRSGKSYMLFKLFYDHLVECGVDKQHIIMVDLEDHRKPLQRKAEKGQSI